MLSETTPERARAARKAIHERVVLLTRLSLRELEQTHIDVLGRPCAIRSRQAIIKRLAMAYQTEELAR